MRSKIKILILVLLCGCSTHTPQENSSPVVSMQLIDRNGFAETISNKERINTYKEVDFLQPQPYQKVLRVFARNAGGQSSSKITSYHENGQIWQYLEVVDGRAHGFYREWFANGQMHIEAYLIEGLADIHDLAQRSWIFDGMSRVWDEQGNVVAHIQYQKGELHAASRYFYPSGALEKIIPYDSGVIEGDLLKYDEKGFLLEHISYRSGQKQGEARCYWSEELPLYIENYENDLLREASYYDREGKCVAKIQDGKGVQAVFKEGHLESLIEHHNGQPEGLVSFFHPDGTLHYTYTVKEGKKNGEEWEYYPCKQGEKMQAKLCVHWHDDKLQGIIKTWYPNGTMESQREVGGNKKQGLCFAWYKNADLMLMEEYENDLLLKGTYFKKSDKSPVSKVENGKGTATLYTSDGIFIKKIPYEKGKPKLSDDDLAE